METQLQTIKYLTAEEAADRIAEKRRESGLDGFAPNVAEDEQEPLYTCECCGGHAFRVLHTYVESETVQTSRPCLCGECEYAASVWTNVEYENEHVGSLDDQHRPDWEDHRREETFREEEDREVYCKRCADDDSESDWIVSGEQDDEPEKLNERWEIRCESCNHEIEFGWSHPDRGGRLWPCEASDFKPMISWSEPRFAEAWQLRGWSHD